MNTPQQVNLGVIGLGNIAQQHIQQISQQLIPHCTLTALCSRQPSALATSLAIPHFADYRELIDSGLCNAVLVATPTFSHFEIGSYALQAGLHLLMEKPIGLSLGEGEQLLALQGEQQVFALMLNQRSDPLFKRMHELIEQGQLGDITRCHWTMTNWFRPEIYFQVSDWRATWRGEGGGLLLNQCIHNLDIFQWLCGMPSKVTAFCQFGKYHNIEVEDEATAYLEYANGASAVFIGSTGEAPGVNRLDIIGDRGSLCFDGERLWLTENNPATSIYSRDTRDMFGMPDSTTRDITPARDLNQHRQILTNFSNAIVTGEALIAPAAEGLQSLALANSMLLSTWQSRPVELPLDSQVYQAELQRHLATSQLREKADIEATIDMNKSYR
jgi:predicted dehydrogenase